MTTDNRTVSEALQQEETAQRVIAVLVSGMKTTQQITDETGLSTAEARVTLHYLEDRHRVARFQTMGEAHPRWVCIEAS